MEIRKETDRNVILSFLRKNPDIQYYCLGDLDDFFFPSTTWYSLKSDDKILSLAMLYSGGEVPTLLLFYEGDASSSVDLLDKIRPLLPGKFFAHLTPPLKKIFKKEEIAEDYGPHYKMVLKLPKEDIPDHNIQRLQLRDIDRILELYSAAYPFNWFDSRMLQTGKYFGYFINNRLTGISGIHVYSPKYRVAALGNIAVAPDQRGKGIAYKLTVRLCNDLRNDTDIIGLNVKSDNDVAIRCYRKAGFEITGEYDECLIQQSGFFKVVLGSGDRND